jgi:hypothetical protein
VIIVLAMVLGFIVISTAYSGGWDALGRGATFGRTRAEAVGGPASLTLIVRVAALVVSPLR